MNTRIKVLTLNAWAIPLPVVCKLRKERIAAIGKELSKAEYDIVLLQEVWDEADYESLCVKISTVLPYNHYFNGCQFGSGLCLFSKHPISETQFFPYHLCGYPHKILHGDWYGYKSVGLAKISIRDMRVNVYITHLHAVYGEDREYKAHRAAQAFQLGQIVKNTSDTCDMVIVGGDFNYQTDEFGYKVIKCIGNLEDSWLSQKRKCDDDSDGHTSDRPDNCFTSPQSTAQRIDYIMYRRNTGFSADCETSRLVLRKVPEQQYNFSDHEGLAVDFSVKKNITAICPSRDAAEVEKLLTEGKMILERGVQKAKSDRVYYLISAFLCLVAVVFTADFGVSWTVWGAIVGVFRTFVTLAIGFFLWMALIFVHSECNVLLGVKKDMDNMLKSSPF